MLLDGEDILARGEETVRRTAGSDIAMVFQGAMNAFNPVKTVGAQIVEPMELHGIGEREGGEGDACGELLELVGIAGDRGRPLPARVLRRDAATRRDRDGARVRAEACCSPTSRRRRST